MVPMKPIQSMNLWSCYLHPIPAQYKLKYLLYIKEDDFSIKRTNLDTKSNSNTNYYRKKMLLDK